MWTPLITLTTLVLLAVIGTAVEVTLTATDQDRGRRALAVLKVLLAATLSASGVFIVSIRLHEAGLL